METVKGFQDISGEDAEKREQIQRIIKNIFEKYGFQPVETPIIEYEDFVKGNSGNQDEAISDIFKLQDKGKRNLALRYEFTFQLKRLILNRKLPFKRYQLGPVFRDEPIQGNRFRQFTQCDVDIIGSTIKDEAEILKIASEILNSLNIKSTIFVNNRKLLNEILDELQIKEKEQAIREIDKLDKLPEKQVLENLKKLKADKLLTILKKDEKFFEKYNSYSEIKELKKYCSYYKINLKFQPFLARGLSYYNGSIFEIKSDIKETISAGGSYMTNGIQSTGISFGLERLALVSKLKSDNKKILLISLDQDKETIKLAEELRNKGKIVSISYGKPSKALEFANAYKYFEVVFIGENEVKKGKYKIKDLATGKEKFVTQKQLLSL